DAVSYANYVHGIGALMTLAGSARDRRDPVGRLPRAEDFRRGGMAFGRPRREGDGERGGSGASTRARAGHSPPLRAEGLYQGQIREQLTSIPRAAGAATPGRRPHPARAPEAA